MDNGGNTAITMQSQVKALYKGILIQTHMKKGYKKWQGKTQGLHKVLIYWAPQLCWVLKNKQR
eukprot:9579559-Ditylum_brightwellii.AAC.1